MKVSKNEALLLFAAMFSVTSLCYGMRNGDLALDTQNEISKYVTDAMDSESISAEDVCNHWDLWRKIFVIMPEAEVLRKCFQMLDESDTRFAVLKAIANETHLIDRVASKVISRSELYEIVFVALDLFRRQCEQLPNDPTMPVSEDAPLLLEAGVRSGIMAVLLLDHKRNGSRYLAY
jgi:hypothetical protein